jgi:hypothetical protein
MTTIVDAPAGTYVVWAEDDAALDRARRTLPRVEDANGEQTRWASGHGWTACWWKIARELGRAVAIEEVRT